MGAFSVYRSVGSNLLKYNQSFSPGSLGEDAESGMCNGPWKERKELWTKRPQLCEISTSFQN